MRNTDRGTRIGGEKTNQDARKKPRSEIRSQKSKRVSLGDRSLPCLAFPLLSYVVGVSEILDEIKSLPPEQRWQILERTREMLGPEIPESFKRGMEEIACGEVIELDEALNELDRQE